MAAVFAHVERSLIPGLSRVPVTRCSGTPVALIPSLVPSAMRSTPDVPVPAQASPDVPFPAEASSSNAGTNELSTPSEDLLNLSAGVGANVIVGGVYSLVGQIMRPGLRRAARRAGALAPAVQIGGEAGAFAVAYAVTSLCKGAAQRVGSILTRIPILGAGNVVGSAIQFAIGSFVGNKIGEYFLREDETEQAPPVFLANLCVMCNEPFDVGCGHTVSALSCGHACLCGGGEGKVSCAKTWLASRDDCPLCRASPMHVLHELKI